jgi:hypothetical protein
MSKQCRGRATRGWGGSRARKRRSLGRDALGPREGGGPNPVATCKAPGIASLVPVLLTQVTQFDLPLGRVDDIRNSAAMTSKSLTAAAQHIRIINPPPPRRHAGDHNIRQHQPSAISRSAEGPVRLRTAFRLYGGPVDLLYSCWSLTASDSQQLIAFARPCYYL